MSGGCLASMVRVGRRQSGKAGAPCQGPWALVEPRHKAVDIHRGGAGDVLHVGLRQAPISGPSEAKGTDPLGERPFDAGPSLIELLPLRAGRPGLCRGQRLVLVLGWEPPPPAGVLGPGTAGPYGTRPTGLFVEGHNDGAITLPTPMLPPRHREVALGAAHVLLIPVYCELLQGVCPLDLGLPPLAGAGGTSQGDALGIAAVHEEFGADIRGIDHVFTRRDVLVDKCLLDRRGALRFMDRGWGGVDVGEQVGHRRLTGFADVHHIARPRRVALVAVARLDIIGRFDPLSGRWQVPARLETHPRRGGRARSRWLTVGPFVVTVPGPAQRLNDR